MAYPKPLDADPIVTVNTLKGPTQMRYSEARKRGLQILAVDADPTPGRTKIRRPVRSDDVKTKRSRG